jgi:hypothetical protein
MDGGAMASVGGSSDNPGDAAGDSDLDGSIPVDFIQGRGHVQERASIEDYQQMPREAFRPYVAPPVTRRRRSDWPVLVFALIVATIVMAGCCLAGFAVYAQNGAKFF